jgi:N-acetyl sugar amidotransferase
MDTSDPEISFNDEGVCNHCDRYDAVVKNMAPLDVREKQLEAIFASVKASARGQDYDCIVGVSGGVDSSYLLHLAVKSGLRPLAVHVDAGWNSELAVKNVESLITTLGVDLFTFVVDWEEMRDLQVAFLKSGVANQDIPQDHAISAAVLSTASKHGIKRILAGSNWSTESILPNSWGYNSRDLRHVKAIARRFGKQKLKKYPTLSFFQQYFYYPYVKGIRTVRPLNFISYSKADAMKVLQDDYGWRYYGGKHYESRFTKFFQAYYLPSKFGYDKRRAHLSSLVVSGQITRAEAMTELEKEIYPAEQLLEDKAFVIKKLGLSESEFDAIKSAPNRSYSDYPSSAAFFRLKDRAKAYLAR